MDGQNALYNKERLVINEYFECDCHSPEHTLQFAVEEIDEVSDWRYPELYVTAYLRIWERGWKRLIKGVKYVLGQKPKYGFFDSFILRSTDAGRFKDLIDHYIAVDARWCRCNGTQKQLDLFDG